MQGRIDVINLLTKSDKECVMMRELEAETKKTPPSLVSFL